VWYQAEEPLSQVAINDATNIINPKEGWLVRSKLCVVQWWHQLLSGIMFVFRIPRLIWLQVKKIWIEEGMSKQLWRWKYYIAAIVLGVVLLYGFWLALSMVSHWDPYGLTDSNDDLLRMIAQQDGGGGGHHLSAEENLKIIELGEVRYFETKHYDSLQFLMRDRALTNKCQPLELSEIKSRTIVVDFESYQLKMQHSSNHHMAHSSSGHDHHHLEGEEINQFQHQDDDSHQDSGDESMDHTVVSLDEVIHVNEESLKRLCNKWGGVEWLANAECVTAILPGVWNLSDVSWYHDPKENKELIQQHKAIKAQLTGFSPCLLTVRTRLGEMITMANPTIVNYLLDHDHPDFTPFNTPFQLDESDVWKMNGYIKLPMYPNLHVDYLDVTVGSPKLDKNHIFRGNDGYIVFAMMSMMYGGQQWISGIADLDQKENPPPPLSEFKSAADWYSSSNNNNNRVEE
jgi:hypothetical protein